LAALSRETWIGIGAAAIGIAAMAVDHLLEEDGGFAADPPVFFASSALVLAVTAYLFGRVVPRVQADDARPRRALTVGFVCALLAVVLIPLTLWLGVPFPLGAGALVLGLIAREGQRKGSAWILIVIGAVVVLLGAVGYVIVAADKLS
jgi:hypothetical protein